MRALSQLAHRLRGKNVRLLLVNVGRDHIELMRRTGTFDELGADNLHRTVRGAVASAQIAPAGASG
jgi:STAS domain